MLLNQNQSEGKVENGSSVFLSVSKVFVLYSFYQFETLFAIWSNFLLYLEEQSLEITSDGKAGQCDIIIHVNGKVKFEMTATSEQLLGSHFRTRD